MRRMFRPFSRFFTPLSMIIFGMVLLTACTTTPTPTVPTPETNPTSTGEATPFVSPTPKEVSPPPTGETVSSLGVDPDQLNGVTVEFWHGFSGARAALLSEWVEAFNASNSFGISVTITTQDDIFNAVQDALRTDASPDLTMGFTYQAAGWEQAALPRASVVDLTPFLSDPVYGFTPEEVADFYPAFLQQETVDGKLLGLPAYRSAEVMLYNERWAQELGFQTPPATPDEFKQQACAAAQARGDGKGGWFLSTDTATTLGWIYAFGGNIVAPDGTYQFNTPETTAAFRFIREMGESGCAWTPETEFPNAEFAAREGLFYATSLSGLAFQQQAFADAGNADTWTLIPFPTPYGEASTYVFGPAYNVLATTPEKEVAAWLFVQWASAPERQVRWTEVGGSFPVRGATIGLLSAYVAGMPQWTRAYDLVPQGKGEPAQPLWGTVQWVVGDAAAQLFSFGFTGDQVPGVVETLEQTANELAGP